MAHAGVTHDRPTTQPSKVEKIFALNDARNGSISIVSTRVGRLALALPYSALFRFVRSTWRSETRNVVAAGGCQLECDDCPGAQVLVQVLAGRHAALPSWMGGDEAFSPFPRSRYCRSRSVFAGRHSGTPGWTG